MLDKSDRKVYITLFKKNMMRFLPLTLLYTLIFFRMSTYRLIGILSGGYMMPARFVQLFQGVAAYIGGDSSFAVFVYFVMAIATGMCVFSYKFKKKNANMIHSLPVDRKGLYVTGVFSGAAMMIAPVLLNSIVMAVLMICYGRAQYIKYVGIIIILTTIISLTGLSIACLCCHLTGSMVVAPFLFIFINSFAVIMEYIIRNLLGVFLYGGRHIGVDYWDIDEMFTSWFSPNIKFPKSALGSDNGNIRSDFYSYVSMKSGKTEILISEINWQVYLIYLAAAAVLFFVGYILYKRYKAERVGDVILFKPVRYAVQYIVGFMAAYYSARIVASLIDDTASYNRLLTYGLTMFLAGTLSFFILEMIAVKKVNVFAGSWRRYLPYALIIPLFLCLLEVDVTGYEKRIPAVEEIACIYINGEEPSHDRMLIEKMHDLHEIVLEDQSYLEKSAAGRRFDFYAPELDFFEYFTISYQLKNGKEMVRHYSLYDKRADSLLKFLWNDLVKTPEYIITDNFGENFDPSTIRQIDVESDTYKRSYKGEGALKIYDALIKDIRENDALQYSYSYDYIYNEVLNAVIKIWTEDDYISIHPISAESENLISVLEDLRFNRSSLFYENDYGDNLEYFYYD